LFGKGGDILEPVVLLLLYSDAPILVAGLQSLLGGVEGFELAPVCSTLPELRHMAAAVNPHIVLMDFTSEMPPGVLGHLDAALLRTNVVLWVYEIQAEMALHAMSLGVRGILRSTLEPELILRCLQKVHQGELWFEKALVDDYMDARKTGLTGREIQLIRLLAMGLKNKEIAGTLSITEGTVKVYLSRLFQKLGVKDRFELALYGMKNPGTGAFRVARQGMIRRVRQRADLLADPDLD
jgi:two-component system nitrate/nitrite response regulator NarL